MKFDEYSQLVSEVPFGKKVNNALYLHVESLHSCPHQLQELVFETNKRVCAGHDYNVIKFYLFGFKISFLFYLDFFERPHPELHSSLTVDLTTGKVRKHEYSHSDNPPILHRKEALLEPRHPLIEKFSSLTRDEERAGLYNAKKIIGFKRNWESLLAAKALSYVGHKLINIEAQSTSQQESAVEVMRHKTAIVRYKLSKPIQTLLENGILGKETILLDYGCGQGDDVERLREMGVAASAWDPAYFPDGIRKPADIVNLGFVLNVIEDPIERMEVLHDAYELSKKLLVVSTLVASSSTTDLGRSYKDGILTSRNTFQKYFRQDELERYIEDVLETPAVAVGLGIFYVFRSPEDQQQFLSNRSKRAINWEEIDRRLRPVREKGLKIQRPGLYERHKELLDAFWSRMLELGRVPLQDEFERYQEVCSVAGSANKARRLFIRKFGEDTVNKAFELRRNDLQVYLALSNFRKKVPFKHLPDGLRKDIKTFLGGYKQANEESQRMLFSIGNPDLIASLCDETPFGVLDHQALFVHTSLVPELDPVLRIYVGCAEVLFGDLREIDIVKIHKRSGKVSLLKYDDFEGKPLPELQERIKVNLRQQSVEVFDHRSEVSQEVLYFKERYVAQDHPERAKWEEFSQRLMDLGLDLETGFGPSKQELVSALEGKGIAIDLDPEGSAEPLTEPE